MRPFALIAFSFLLSASLMPSLCVDSSGQVFGQPPLKQAAARFGSNWLRHAESVQALAFSGSGDYLISGGNDRHVRIWDLKERRLVRQLAGDADMGHFSVAISPYDKNVAALTGDGKLRLWEFSTGLLKWEKQLHEDSGVSQVAFFSDGQRIASSGTGGIVIVSDVDSGETQSSISCQSADESRKGLPFAIAPDDSTIAMGVMRNIEIVSVEDPSKRATISGCHGDRINSLSFTPDGTRLFSCGASWTAAMIGGKRVMKETAEWKLWRLSESDLIRGYNFEALNASAGCGKISPDGRAFAAGYGAIVVWDLNTGQLLQSIENRNRHAGWFQNGFDLSPNGLRMAAVDGNSILLWDTQTGSRILDENPAHPGVVTDVVFSPDGHLFASAGRTGDVRIWDRKTRTLAHELFPVGHQSVQVDSVVFSPDSRRLIAAGTCLHKSTFAGTLSQWDTKSGETIRTKILPARATIARFSMSGNQITVGAGIGNPFGGANPFAANRTGPAPHVVLFDDRLTLQKECPGRFMGRVIAIHAGKEKGEILLVEDSKKLWHWKPESDDLISIPLRAARQSLKSAAFNKDGSILATSGLFDDTIYLWDTLNGKQLAVFNYENSMGSMLAFSADDKLLAIAPIGLTRTTREFAKNIILWDTTNQVKVGELEFSIPHASAVAFSLDGSELLTGHEDGTLTLWNCPR